MPSAASPRRPAPTPYVNRLLGELDRLETEYLAVLERSAVRNIDPNRHGSQGVAFLGFAEWGWVPSEADVEADRMRLLETVRQFRPRFELLFPHPTPEVQKRHNTALDRLERWLVRPSGDKTVPGSIPTAAEHIGQAMATLRAARDLLPRDPIPVRVVVDTNAVIDCPDLAVYVDQIGQTYRAHVMPVVLGELDDLKRAGRTPELREAAKAASRRLKGLRDNGDVTQGVRVAGGVTAVFEHVEPRAGELPDWLDLTVPDDRFVASVLTLQSAHPGASVYAITSDLNLQTKLSALGMPFVEPPDV